MGDVAEREQPSLTQGRVMNILSRWLMKRLGRMAGPYLKSHGLLKANKYNPAILRKPEGGRIVVLAPHMDDEIIGCGGTLYQHLLQGATITVLYLTDGRFAGELPQAGAREQRRQQAPSLVAVRRQEALLAMQTLGIQNGIFLDAKDGQLSSDHGLSSRVREILHSIQPHLVYLPFFLEEHPDHRAATQILMDATEGAGFGFDCCGYEVWTPLFPNCLVNIDAAVTMKKRALRRYQSQLLDNDYLHASLGLNAYRSIALSGPRGRFVEAFFMASLQEYRDLYKAYRSWIQQVKVP
jgi:LmbE family N-acetylglucosaminyl deacetylase